MAIMLLAATCIGIQAFFVKVATQYTGPAEIAFLRFLFSFLIIQVAITGGWIEVRVVNWRMVLARGVLGGIGNLLYFYAIEATRLSNAIILLYTYPIFASLYTQMMYRQGLGVSTVGAFLISFAGISLIVDPTFQDIQRGDLLALLSGAMVGGALEYVALLSGYRSLLDVIALLTMYGTMLQPEAIVVKSGALKHFASLCVPWREGDGGSQGPGSHRPV